MIYAVKDRETISSLVAATGFTAAKINPTQAGSFSERPVKYAICQALGGDIRITEDGTTPTTSVGLKILQNTIFEIWGEDAIKNFLAINDGGTATLEVVYMG